MAKKSDTYVLERKLPRSYFRFNWRRGREMFGNKFEKLLSNLLVFLIPTQLAYHFWPSYAFSFGIRVDYLAPTIYFTDLLIVLLLLLNINLFKIYKKELFVLFVFATFNIFVSKIPLVTLFKFLKLFEFIVVSLVLKKYDIKKSLYLSLSFFSIVGIYQFMFGHTTNLLYLLGERTFSISTPSISLVNLFGQNYLRAYSTFPHPNALAGYLSLGLIYLFEKKFKFDYKLVVIILCLVATFSLSASLGVVGYFVLKSKFDYKYIVIFILLSFIFPFIDLLKTIDLERVKLGIESLGIIKKNLISGIGFNVYPKLSYIRQPVHNLFLLIMSEGGILIFLPLVDLLIKNIMKYKLFILVLIIGLFDHYFITINQNLLLLTLLTTLW